MNEHQIETRRAAEENDKIGDKLHAELRNERDKGWAGGKYKAGTLTEEDIRASVGAMSDDEVSAEAEMYIDRCISAGLAECALDLTDLKWNNPSLMADVLRASTEDADVHLRCYVLMIRDRSVSLGCGRCQNHQWPACPVHGTGTNMDPCFACEGCGCDHGGCECDGE